MAEPATTSPSDLYCAKDRDPSSAGSGIRYSEFEGKRLVEVGEALSDHLLRFVDTVSGHGRPQAKGEFPLPTTNSLNSTSPMSWVWCGCVVFH